MKAAVTAAGGRQGTEGILGLLLASVLNLGTSAVGVLSEHKSSTCLCRICAWSCIELKTCTSDIHLLKKKKRPLEGLIKGVTFPLPRKTHRIRHLAFRGFSSTQKSWMTAWGIRDLVSQGWRSPFPCLVDPTASLTSPHLPSCLTVMQIQLCSLP